MTSSHYQYFVVFFFFFQTEDGIRDKLVTGVQTCALPISSKELVSFEDRGGVVVARFSDGSEYQGHAMIGADGLRSRVRETLMDDGPPKPAGHVTYRGVVPLDQVRDQSHFDDMVIWIGPNLHFVQYRLRR